MVANNGNDLESPFITSSQPQRLWHRRSGGAVGSAGGAAGGGHDDGGGIYYDSNGGGNYQAVNAGGNGDSSGNGKEGSPPPGQPSGSQGRPHRRPRIHWRYPATAVLLFAAGVLFAVGHDIYYHRLDGQLADTASSSSISAINEVDALVNDSGGKQTWAIRIGTGLAFLNKTVLTAVIGLVGAQQVWFTLRRKAMTVDGIDSMFDIMGNPLALLDWDLLANAKLLVVLAIISWLVPLASVVTPATLSVRALPLDTVVQMAVPGFNFSDFSEWAMIEGIGHIEGANFEISTLFSNVYSSYSFVSMAAPFPNSSYEQTLYGPSYKCISLNAALAANFSAPWTIDNPPGSANTTYPTFADAFYGELGVPSVHDPLNYSEIVYSAAAPHYMFNMILISAGGTNPLWDGGNDTLINSTTLEARNRTFTYDTLSGPPGSNMVCQLYNTSFDLSLRFENGVQSVVPLNVEYLEAQDWPSTPGQFANPPDLDPCQDVIAGQPTSYGNCSQATATYYVTHLLFSYLLGTLLHDGASGLAMLPGGLITVPLLQSALIHCPELYNSTQFNDSTLITDPSQLRPDRCRNGTLAAAIEDLSRNFTYSLLTFDGWPNVTQPGGAAVTQTADRLFFAYARRTLWAAYAAALGATLLAMAAGARALRHNGVVSSTSFSATLLTTRNPQLSGLVLRGAPANGNAGANDNADADAGAGADTDTVYARSVGAQPVDGGIGRLRLRFGHIDTGDGVPQAGFGLDGTVRPLRDGY